ncbi:MULTISPECIES: GGDEF domain-containing protein [Clostridium]|uniref:GGDEF domain-containing protein n=1 Tax=Clostridium TaxID=1485 RepID=UPI0002D18BF2|nr:MULTISPECIES: GGDEF domain-containing protein [Clostridium]ENZ31645.1 diguanylate cyclase (GGDEF) domain-containing protein [Clostridium butyricum 60E.3]MDU1336978.1 GGDEF domain-containing protein [Clostridium butyricum]MDU3091731.1 GGDEF domain-containing protein [Clostridium sp.]MDU3584426.1 GGDEF domain-containing protein [Clostridium butyricum]MDU3597724.1 GGDEF domain-containing protein [Clostridium butyricum]
MKNKKFENYYDDIQEYTCKAQQIFSCALCLGVTIYMLITMIINHVTLEKSNFILVFYFFQALIHLLFFVLFKYYCYYNKKHTMKIAYINVCISIILTECQYVFFDEEYSYTILILVMLVASFTFIGLIKQYSLILILSMVTDIIATISRMPENIWDYDVLRYCLDNILVLACCIGMHYSFSKLKFREFKQKYELIYLSERDSLTNLLNRKAIEKIVKTYEGSNCLCSMIIMDIDNFKSVNDTFGHIKGDELLIEISMKLHNVFGHINCISRLGGDEFCVFIPNIIEKKDVVKKANEIMNYFPIVLSSGVEEVIVSGSIGIAYTQAIGSNLYEELYQNADYAMYDAKKNGKNQIKIADMYKSHYN